MCGIKEDNMNTIKITISNKFLPQTTPEVFVTRADITDLAEVEMAIEECCGQYLDIHGDIYNAILADVDWETFAEACEYVVEEV